jgi:hypothetical protein
MKVKQIAAIAVLAAGVTAGVAAPAHAVPPGSLYGYYVTLTECRAAGLAGQQEGVWAWYFCSRPSPSALWALYID